MSEPINPKTTEEKKMANTIQKLAILTAGFTASLAVIDTNLAIAATITYDFEVSIDSGPLLDETYSGSFSFNDLTLTGAGFEFVDVSELEFSFLEANYTETDDLDAGVEFLDSDFLGLSFKTDTFAFIPGFFNGDEAFFSYDIAQGAGAGDVSYSLQQKPPVTPVPEPHSVAGILAIGFLGGIGLFKRKHK